MLRSQLHLRAASSEREYRSDRKGRARNGPGYGHLYVIRVPVRARRRQCHGDGRRVRSADDTDARHRQHAAANGPALDFARGVRGSIWSATTDMDAVSHLVIAARVTWIE